MILPPVIIDGLSWVLLIAGSFFSIVGAIGMLRMPDVFTRMHAASVTETLGVALILLGLMLQSGLNLVSAKLLMLGILIFITGPTATHAIAHAAILRGLKPILKSDRSEKEIS